MIMIIQLNLHRGFSVTDYIKYYAYLYYLLSLDYLFLQQLWYYFPNYSMFIGPYPNPPWQLSLCEETRAPGENPRLGRALTDSFHMHESTPESVARIEPTISEVKGARSDDCATEAPDGWKFV